MRAREFLIEYDRQITKQKFGDKLLGTFKKESPRFQKNALGYALHNIGDIEPQHQKIIDDIIKKLETMDPTPNKEYVPWLARMYTNQDNVPADTERGWTNMLHLEDIDSSAYAYLEKFHKLKQRRMIPAPRNDINKYREFSNFLNVIDEYPDPFAKKEELPKGDAKVVYEDGTVKVIHPKNKEAACYYGQGTKWCTAATKGTNYFEHYNQEGPLYILFPKKPNYPGEKYQVHFQSSQFKDPQDDDVELPGLIKRFSGFFEWVKKYNPEAKNYLVFVSNDVINKITKVVSYKVIDFTLDVIDEFMEEKDDGFREWQVEEAKARGYVDKEGNIDWDQVYEDDELNDYLKYNDDARIMMREAERFNSISADTVRAEAIANYELGDEVPQVGNLVDAYTTIANDTISNTVGDLILHNIRIVEKGKFEKNSNFQTKYKLVGNAGDYDVYSANFGVRDVR
jgi:hypothetical protein